MTRQQSLGPSVTVQPTYFTLSWKIGARLVVYYSGALGTHLAAHQFYTSHTCIVDITDQGT